MTTTNKLDLRNCPMPQLCEWVAANIMGWKKVRDASELVGFKWVDELGECVAPSSFIISLDAVAAVERKLMEKNGGYGPTVEIDKG